jgi:hypothetical protein
MSAQKAFEVKNNSTMYNSKVHMLFSDEALSENQIHSVMGVLGCQKCIAESATSTYSFLQGR